MPIKQVELEERKNKMNKEMKKELEMLRRNCDNFKKEIVRLSNEAAEEIDKFGKKIFKQAIEAEAKYGQEYYSFDEFGTIVKKKMVYDAIDRARLSMNIVFWTEEVAEFERKKRTIKEELERYARKHNREGSEEFGHSDRKFCVAYDEQKEKIVIVQAYPIVCESTTYFTSWNEACNAIEEIGRDKIKKYLFGIKDKEKTEC